MSYSIIARVSIFVERKASLAPRRNGPRSRVDDFYDHPTQFILKGLLRWKAAAPSSFPVGQQQLLKPFSGCKVASCYRKKGCEQKLNQKAKILRQPAMLRCRTKEQLAVHIPASACSLWRISPKTRKTSPNPATRYSTSNTRRPNRS